MKKEEASVKISSKEKLLSISDLNAAKISEMSDEQMHDYAQSLNTFVEIFPVQQERLKIALQTREYASALQWLISIGNALSQIHADDLAKDCQKQITLSQNTDIIRHEKIEAFSNYFLTALSILFEDVQQVLEKQESAFEQEEVEEPKINFAEIKESLLSISELNAEKIKQIEDDHIQDYIGALAVFVSDMPIQEKGIKGALRSKNYESILQRLGTIGDALSQIHADSLLEDCRNQIKLNSDINNIRHEKLEAFVDYFLASLSMLISEIKQWVPVSMTAATEFLPFTIDPSKKNILVINDMSIFLQSLRRALEDNENKVTCIASKEAALIYLKIAKPDLLILDDDMPGMDGCELVRKIHEMRQSIPVIFLTSNITKEYMVKAMSAGAADFIVKPISAKDVQDKIDKHLT